MIKVTTEIATLLVLMAPSVLVVLQGISETLQSSPRLQALCLEAAIPLSNTPSSTHTHILSSDVGLHSWKLQSFSSSMENFSPLIFFSHIWETTYGSGQPFEPLLLLASWGSMLSGCLCRVDWPDTLCKQLLCAFCSYFFSGVRSPRPLVHVSVTSSP